MDQSCHESGMHSVRVAARLRLFASCICLIFVGAADLSAQEWRRVATGVEHAHVRREFSGKPVDINLLRLDLRRVRLDVHHATGRAIGLETTSSIAQRHKAVAAINAGFFRLDQSVWAGDPVGLFMVDGIPLSEATNERIQLLINNQPSRTDVWMARTKLVQTVTIDGEIFNVTGINRERTVNDDLVIYTPEFGRTTLTDSKGVELVIVRGAINSVMKDLGNAVIPANGFVLSASGPVSDRLATMAKLSKAVTLTRKWEGLPADLERDRARLDVVTGVPQLVRAGSVEITWEQERSSRSFVETRHPRTAVAKLRDGRFLMLTADGRTDQSAGLDLNDLAKYLVELGAVEAMNLDGGGSTTMFVGGKVVNRPSDPTGERRVSDVIVVTPRGRR